MEFEFFRPFIREAPIIPILENPKPSYHAESLQKKGISNFIQICVLIIPARNPFHPDCIQKISRTPLAFAHVEAFQLDFIRLIKYPLSVFPAPLITKRAILAGK